MDRSRKMYPVEPVDVIYFVYVMAIIVLLVAFGKSVPHRIGHLVLHVAFLGIGVLILCLRRRRSGHLSRFCRVWYVPFFYVFLFVEVGLIIHIVQPRFFDAWVLGLEVATFGVYPTAWLQGMARPWLTEIMSLFYMTYYFFIPVLGLPLYFQHEWEKVNDLILTTSVTFFFCYLHYIFLPVAGPIFIPNQLPFKLLSLTAGPITTLEQWIFFKGAIQGAAFPSSHVAVAVAVCALAIKYRRWSWIFGVVVMGLAFSTVYNGYHYGVDVIYGAAVGFVFARVCPSLNRIWTRRWEKPDRQI